MTTHPVVPMHIGGQFIDTDSETYVNITDPSTQDILGQVPFATDSEIDRAVQSAKWAFGKWKQTSPQERMRLMLNYQALLKSSKRDIAAIISQECGKTREEANNDIERGIEVVEHAATICSLGMGETLSNVRTNTNAYSFREPLGVCVGIAPFNFPAMLPLWMFPLAIACGNTFILKPSEQVPLTALRLVELFLEAGGDPETLQVVHGREEQVDRLIQHPDVKAVSFIGTSAVGQEVYHKATTAGKRAQAMVSAKNHMVIMPDANYEMAINALIDACTGSAGQRCMAISVAVLVGDARQILRELASRMQMLEPGHPNDRNAHYGPLISKEAAKRVKKLIVEGKSEGAVCIVDGSKFKNKDLPKGNWVGPTLFAEVKPEMAIYQQEIFGPVLCVMTVNNLTDAVHLINDNPYGNATSIFTRSGSAARQFEHEIQVGNVGINVATPVPYPVFNFSGWRGSFHGDLHAYGKDAIRFYTETKTVTARWPRDVDDLSLISTDADKLSVTASETPAGTPAAKPAATDGIEQQSE